MSPALGVMKKEHVKSNFPSLSPALLHWFSHFPLRCFLSDRPVSGTFLQQDSEKKSCAVASMDLGGHWNLSTTIFADYAIFGNLSKQFMVAVPPWGQFSPLSSFLNSDFIYSRIYYVQCIGQVSRAWYDEIGRVHDSMLNRAVETWFRVFFLPWLPTQVTLMT